MVGHGLEVYKGLIYLWWDLARHSEGRITQMLQRANVRTTESEIHDALEEWGFLSFPSPNVSPEDTGASTGERHTSNFLNDGLPAFLEAWGKPEPIEDPKDESTEAAIERFRCSEEDSTPWYAKTNDPVLPEDDAAQATHPPSTISANIPRTGTSRETRITQVVDRIEEVLPEIDDVEDDFAASQDAFMETWHRYKASSRAMSSALGREAHAHKMRKREPRKKGVVEKEVVEKEEAAEVEAVKNGEEEEQREWGRSEGSVAASHGSGYDSAKRLRRFSVSEDEEVVVAKMRKVGGEGGGRRAGGDGADV